MQRKQYLMALIYRKRQSFRLIFFSFRMRKIFSEEKEPSESRGLFYFIQVGNCK